MTKLGGAGRAGGLISATVRTVRYYGEADKITVTRRHGQLTTSRILELESRKPPPLYPEPRARSSAGASSSSRYPHTRQPC